MEKALDFLRRAILAKRNSVGDVDEAQARETVARNFANVASKGARKEVKHGLSPEKTVRHAVKASRRKKLYSMYAFKWKFKATASKFISRYLGAWATYKFCKRPSN